MTTILYGFTADYKADMHRHIDKLFTQAKTLNTDRQTRLNATDDLIEAYFAHTEKAPDGNHLERMATLILRDELTDPHPDKMSRAEYPIMSDSQRDERLSDEVSEIWAENVGTDGRDYKLPTRENMRKLR